MTSRGDLGPALRMIASQSEGCRRGVKSLGCFDDRQPVSGQHRKPRVMGGGIDRTTDPVDFLGAPLVVVVGLKPISASLDTSRSVVALAASLVWLGTGLGGIIMGRWRTVSGCGS